MKNYFLLFLLLSLYSCSSEFILNQNLDSKETRVNNDAIFPVETAFPEKKLELDTLANGIVVERFDSTYILQNDIILSKKQVELLTAPQLDLHTYGIL